MYRTIVCAALALVMFTVVAFAKEVTGKAKKCDAKTLCLTVDGKDVELKLTDKTQWLNAKGDALKDKQKEKLTEGISSGKMPEMTVDYDDATKEVKSVKVKGGKKQQ